MYALACCDNTGKCIGFLSKEDTVVTDKSKLTEEYLQVFRRKSDTNEKVMQINMAHVLLPNAPTFRVTPVKM